ncbi:4790_t:CDS:2 [Funneliformis mosseae]|uniref:4790_t:CDS:1 n=1 Tax=Funneliformis mosseae TaxID=27381 RepID=A0A9N9D9K3_FUNMO|nr:4790_t:CDS:2 [Funneliformis mosseae]
MAKQSTEKMDETIIKGLSKAVQKPTLWAGGQEDYIWTLSTDINHYFLGRDMPPLHTLYQPPYQESDSREAGDISYTEVEISAQFDKEEGNERKMSTNRDKSDIFTSKQQTDEIYDRGISSINTKTASINISDGSQYITTGGGSVKGETDANIQAECESHESMLQMSEGNGNDVSHTSNRNSQKSPMVVEMIAHETDRQLIASMLKIEFDERLKCYNYELKEIREFGFTHIIIVGMLQFGPMFIDCYGRIFNLDTMTGVLWKVGNSLEEAAMEPFSIKTAWIVEEDGTIDDFEFDPTNSQVFEDQKIPKVEKAKKK